MEHSRVHFLKLRPEVGDTLITNRRRPILTLVEDTSPGVHDTVLAACDARRYEFLGVGEYHDNCSDNLSNGLGDLGLEMSEEPSSFNLFMNIPWTEDGRLTFEAPVTKPGDLGRDGRCGSVLRLPKRHPAHQRTRPAPYRAPLPGIVRSLKGRAWEVLLLASQGATAGRPSGLSSLA